MHKKAKGKILKEDMQEMMETMKLPEIRNHKEYKMLEGKQNEQLQSKVNYGLI
jgi:hypothetical protein